MNVGAQEHQWGVIEKSLWDTHLGYEVMHCRYLDLGKECSTGQVSYITTPLNIISADRLSACN